MIRTISKQSHFTSYDNSVILNPGEKLSYTHAGVFDDMEDPVIDRLFNSSDNIFEQEIYIQWNDSLRKTWYGIGLHGFYYFSYGGA